MAEPFLGEIRVFAFGQIPSEAQGLTTKQLLVRLEGEEPWAQPMRDALEAMKPGECGPTQTPAIR